MAEPKSELLQGTLHMLILKALERGPLHGYSIVRRIEESSDAFLRVEEGSYVNGAFTTLRLLNGDQTDGGLDFSSEPLVLRVTLATY